jgi:cytidine deaminase
MKLKNTSGKMKKIHIGIHYREYSDIGDLDSGFQDLLLTARKAANDAYAPYSGFKVGAAVLLESGIIVTGNNQENAAYPSGLCAERVALFAASSQYPGVPVTALAVTAKSREFFIDYPINPCGACRQVIAEYENVHKKPITLILSGESGIIHVFDDIESLLPLRFDASQLKPRK